MCPYCGKWIRYGNFCGICGAKFHKTCNCWILKKRFNCGEPVGNNKPHLRSCLNRCLEHIDELGLTKIELYKLVWPKESFDSFSSYIESRRMRKEKKLEKLSLLLNAKSKSLNLLN